MTKSAAAADHWQRLIIPRMQRKMYSWDARNSCEVREITEAELSDELKRVFGQAPTKTYWAASRPYDHPDEGRLIACFSQTAKVRTGCYTIFNKLVRAYVRTRKPTRRQCRLCWAHHAEATCSRQPRCGVCASKDHKTEAHKDSPRPEHLQCAQCNGPHRADDPNCPAKPRYSSTEGRFVQMPADQLKALRAVNTKAQREKTAAAAKQQAEQFKTPSASSAPTSAEGTRRTSHS